MAADKSTPSIDVKNNKEGAFGWNAAVLTTVVVGAISGFLGAFGADFVLERTEPHSSLTVQIADVDFGFPKFELEDWDRILTRSQAQNIADEMEFVDDFVATKDFVTEFNSLSSQSLLIPQLIERTYSAEDFIDEMFGPLWFYGDYGVYIDVVEAWASEADGLSIDQREEILSFYENGIGSFLQGTGIFNSLTASIMNGDIVIPSSSTNCGDKRAGLISRYTTEDSLNLDFGSFRVRLGPHFGQATRTLAVSNRVGDLFEHGCTEQIAELFRQLRSKFQNERRLIERLVRLTNNQLEVSAPQRLQITAILFNDGRFGVVTTDQAVLSFSNDDVSPIILVSLTASKNVISIPQREAIDVRLEAKLADSRAVNLHDIFRAGTTSVAIQFSTISSRGNEQVRSSEVRFSAAEW